MKALEIAASLGLSEATVYRAQTVPGHADSSAHIGYESRRQHMRYEFPRADHIPYLPTARITGMTRERCRQWLAAVGKGARKLLAHPRHIDHFLISCDRLCHSGYGPVRLTSCRALPERYGADHVALLTFLARHGERRDFVDAVYNRLSGFVDWFDATNEMAAVAIEFVVAESSSDARLRHSKGLNVGRNGNSKRRASNPAK